MNQLEEWFFDIPLITRTFITGIVLVTASIQLQLLSPIHIFFSWKSIYEKGEWWRLLSSFFYFGPPSFDLLFHMYILMRYSRMTEEGYRSKPWEYLWMILLASVSIVVTAAIFEKKKAMPWLSYPLYFMLVYVWSRRNPLIRMNFLDFNAPYLPWVLIGFSVLLNQQWPWHDVLGLCIGHLYYFLEDIYPRMPSSGGRRLLKCPLILRQLFESWTRAREDAQIPQEQVEHPHEE